MSSRFPSPPPAFFCYSLLRNFFFSHPIFCLFLHVPVVPLFLAWSYAFCGPPKPCTERGFPTQQTMPILGMQEHPGADPISLMNLPGDRLLVLQAHVSLVVSFPSQGPWRVVRGLGVFLFLKQDKQLLSPSLCGFADVNCSVFTLRSCNGNFSTRISNTMYFYSRILS